MYKASIEIGRVNKMMKIKFGLVIKSDEETKFKANKLVSKFSYSGNDYLRINPNPYVILDITSFMDKGEGWSSNRTVTLNRYYLFRFLQGLKRLINDFQNCKNLFYYRSNELVVNNSVADSITISIPTAGSKTIMMKPCVVPDEESSTGNVYEGCIFYINNMENFAYLTYTEMEYLFYELSKIDMNTLSLQLITIVKEFETQESEKLNVPTSSQEDIDSEIEISTPSSLTIIKRNQLTQI
jgi:hypothetical protein